jgi:hypothetical protein
MTDKKKIQPLTRNVVIRVYDEVGNLIETHARAKFGCQWMAAEPCQSGIALERVALPFITML